MGALSGAHQFCRIGKHSMIGGLSGVDSDVIPYGTVIGNRAYSIRIEYHRAQRRVFLRDIIQDLRKAYGLLFSSQEGTFSDRVNKVSEEFLDNEPIQENQFIFLKSEKSKIICKPKNAD